MTSRNPARPRSGWSAVRMWQQDLAQSLQRRHALRLHGWIIGSITLLVTWGVSHLLLGATIDHFIPQAQSLPEALRIIRHGA